MPKGEVLYLLFRIVVGGMFLMHGLVKFGVFGGEPVTEMLFMLAGLAEVLVGIGVLAGLFTRLSAIFGIIVMAGALAMVHLPQGLNPLENGGELALLYLVSFIAILAYGAGKYGIEHKILKKEIF